jgi:hypothetical protein
MDDNNEGGKTSDFFNHAMTFGVLAVLFAVLIMCLFAENIDRRREIADLQKYIENSGLGQWRPNLDHNGSIFVLSSSNPKDEIYTYQTFIKTHGLGDWKVEGTGDYKEVKFVLNGEKEK